MRDLAEGTMQIGDRVWLLESWKGTIEFVNVGNNGLATYGVILDNGQFSICTQDEVCLCQE